MNRSETIGSIAKALSGAQASYEAVVKDTQGHQYKYASLDQYHAVLQKAFGEFGLSYIQSVETSDNAIRVETLLMHESGEWLSGTGPWVTFTIKTNAAQDIGSATTYAKRYALATFCGIEKEDDDAASEQGSTQPPKTQARQKAKPPVKPPAKTPVQTVASLTQHINNAVDDKALTDAGSMIGEFLADTENMRFADELRASYKSRLDAMAAMKEQVAA